MFDDVLVWLDVEATGLDSQAKLLEVGVIVTDAALQELERLEVRLTVPSGPVSSWALRTFTRNGLLDACRADGVPPHVAEAQLVGLLSKYGPTGLVAAGSSVSSDLAYLASWMPSVHAMFGHQVVDVTTLLLLQRRWNVCVPNMPRSRHAHRALWDAEDSLELLRAYKREWLAKEQRRCSSTDEDHGFFEGVFKACSGPDNADDAPDGTCQTAYWTDGQVVARHKRNGKWRYSVSDD